MIDLNAVTKAVGQVIIASGAFPRILWTNRDGLPEKPFLIAELRTKTITDPTLDQAAPQWTGEFTGTIVTDLNQFDAEGAALIGQLAALFPSGSRLTLSTGQKVMIAGHPSPLPGYRDGADYRLQLSIPLQSD